MLKNAQFIPVLASIAQVLNIVLVSNLLFPSLCIAEQKALIYCSEGSPEYFTPALSKAPFSFDAQRPIFNQLVAFKQDSLDLVPSLAESWSMSEDGTVLTFKLRRDVKFHSGVNGFTPTRPLSADDVLFSFNRQWQPNHPYHKISHGNYAYFTHTGFKDMIKTIEKEDDYTIHFTLHSPNSSLLSHFAMDFLSIHSAEYADFLLSQNRAEEFDNAPVGTGPFQFVSYLPDTLIEFKAFDAHWAGRPQIDKLTFAITPNPSERAKKIKSNACQVMAFPDSNDLLSLMQDPALSIVQAAGANIGYLAYNVSRKPFDDPRIRQAVALSIDRKALVTEAYGPFATPAHTLLPLGMFNLSGEPSNTVNDIEQAKSLLKEAGVALPLKVDLFYSPVAREYNPNPKRAAEFIQGALEKIGIHANLRTHSWDEYRRNLRKGDFDLAQFGWVTDHGDPHSVFAQLSCHSVEKGQNISRWCNENFDALLHQGQIETSLDKRRSLYKGMKDILAQELPWYSIAHSTINVPIRKTVIGYAISPLGRHDFHKVDLKM
jgi:dipeptide transport system substrate-binding protein